MCIRDSNMGGFKSNWSNIAQSEAWGFVALHGADWALMFGATMISFTTAAKFFMPVIGWVIDKIGAIKTNVLTLALIFVGFLGLLFFHNVEAVVLASCFLIGLWRRCSGSWCRNISWSPNCCWWRSPRVCWPKT